MIANLARRAHAAYGNLPLPAGSAVGVVLVLVLDGVRPAPLPGRRAVHRIAGSAALVAGGALNARVPRYPGLPRRRLSRATRRTSATRARARGELRP